MATFTTVGLMELEKAGLVRRYQVCKVDAAGKPVVKDGKPVVLKIVLAFDMTQWTESLELK